MNDYFVIGICTKYLHNQYWKVFIWHMASLNNQIIILWLVALSQTFIVVHSWLQFLLYLFENIEDLNGKFLVSWITDKFWCFRIFGKKNFCSDDKRFDGVYFIKPVINAINKFLHEELIECIFLYSEDRIYWSSVQIIVKGANYLADVRFDYTRYLVISGRSSIVSRDVVANRPSCAGMYS